MEIGQKKIIVVDDSRTVRQLLRLLIGKHFSAEVIEAEDGMEAMEKLGTDHSDLVITDINMPRMDGLSLVSKIRNVFGMDLPIVIVTTVGKEDDRDAGLKLGADSYLTKPINAAQFTRTVSTLVN